MKPAGDKFSGFRHCPAPAIYRRTIEVVELMKQHAAERDQQAIATPEQSEQLDIGREGHPQ